MMGTDSSFWSLDFDSIQLEIIKHVWDFEPILEHILFSYVMHLQATRHMFLREFVVFGTTWKVW